MWLISRRVLHLTAAAVLAAGIAISETTWKTATVLAAGMAISEATRKTATSSPSPLAASTSAMVVGVIVVVITSAAAVAATDRPTRTHIIGYLWLRPVVALFGNIRDERCTREIRRPTSSNRKRQSGVQFLNIQILQVIHPKHLIELRPINLTPCYVFLQISKYLAPNAAQRQGRTPFRQPRRG